MHGRDGGKEKERQPFPLYEMRIQSKGRGRILGVPMPDFAECWAVWAVWAVWAGVDHDDEVQCVHGVAEHMVDTLTVCSRN